MKQRLGALTTIALVLTTSCSPQNGGDEVSTVPGTEPPTTIASVWDEGRSPADVVLELERGGGHTPAWDNATRLPLMVLYGDGTLVGMARLEGVNPKLVPLNRVILTSDQRAEIDSLIDQMQLRDISDEMDTSLVGQAFDFPTTTATFTDRTGVEHQYGAYALTAASGEDAQTNALARLFEGFGSLSWRQDGEEVEGMRVQLYLFPGDIGSGQPVDWPLQVTPDDFGSFGPGGSECLHLSGPAARSEAQVLTAAKQRTSFVIDGTQHYIAARFLLPHESPCGPEIASLGD